MKRKDELNRDKSVLSEDREEDVLREETVVFKKK